MPLLGPAKACLGRRCESVSVGRVPGGRGAPWGIHLAGAKGRLGCHPKVGLINHRPPTIVHLYGSQLQFAGSFVLRATTCNANALPFGVPSSSVTSQTVPDSTFTV